MKTSHMVGKKISVDHISDKELVSKIHIYRTPMMCGQKGPHAKPDKRRGSPRGGPYNSETEITRPPMI